MQSKTKNIVLGIVAVAAVAGALMVWFGGSSKIGVALRQVKPRVTLYSTSTLATYSDVPVSGVNDFRHVEFAVGTENSSGTLKFACSNSVNVPDFSVIASVTNTWDYIEVIDKENGNIIDGDTGITLNNTRDLKRYELNENHSKWCTAILSGNTSPLGLGTTTVYLNASTN